MAAAQATCREILSVRVVAAVPAAVRESPSVLAVARETLSVRVVAAAPAAGRESPLVPAVAWANPLLWLALWSSYSFGLF